MAVPRAGERQHNPNPRRNRCAPGSLSAASHVRTHGDRRGSGRHRRSRRWLRHRRQRPCAPAGGLAAGGPAPSSSGSRRCGCSTPAGASDGPIGVPAAKKLGAGESIDVAVGGVGAIPDDATSVAVNITIDEDATLKSFLTVWPTGQTRPEHLGQQRRARPGDGQLGHLPARHRRQAQRVQPARRRQRDHGRDRLLRALGLDAARRDDHDQHDGGAGRSADLP